MLYRVGEAYGQEQAVRVTQAGTWALGRWDGKHWSERTYQVDADGRATVTRNSGRDRPDGDAWWRVSGDDGQPLPRHHVVCWWEAEQLRQPDLPEPPGWSEQGTRPAQPGLGLDMVLVQRVVARIGEVAVPERAQALAFALRLRQPVWFSDARARLSLVGGGGDAASGVLVLVPATPPQP
jgi:hypothetical protein